MTNTNEQVRMYNSDEVKHLLDLSRDGRLRTGACYSSPWNRVYEGKMALEAYRQIPNDARTDEINKDIAYLIKLLGNSRTIDEALAFANRRSK